MTPRAKALIGSALTVVVLAVVFFVGWSVSSSRTPKPSVPQTITLSPAQQSQDAYQKGMSALSSEERTRARKPYAAPRTGSMTTPAVLFTTAIAYSVTSPAHAVAAIA